MPGPVLHLGATVLCSHAGPATPVAPNPRVTLGGQPVVTLASPWVVTGCALSGSGSPFCVTGQFVTAATRVTVLGQPVLLLDSQGIASPTGQPLTPIAAGPRVTGI
jgi:hypothetical protein